VLFLTKLIDIRKPAH